MSFVFGRYPAGDSQDGVGPSLDQEIEAEEKIDNSIYGVADDVKAAIFQHRGSTTDDDKQAWRDWVDDSIKHNADPVQDLQAFHAADAMARQNIAYVEPAMEGLVMRPNYKASPPKDEPDHIAAARAAYKAASQYGRFDQVKSEAHDLAKHSGNFSDFVANALETKRVAREGTPAEIQRQTLSLMGHYSPTHKLDPDMVAAHADLHAILPMIPDIDPDHPSYDHDLRQRTAKVLSGMKASDDNAYQMISAARQQALRERRGR